MLPHDLLGDKAGEMLASKVPTFHESGGIDRIDRVVGDGVYQQLPMLFGGQMPVETRTLYHLISIGSMNCGLVCPLPINVYKAVTHAPSKATLQVSALQSGANMPAHLRRDFERSEHRYRSVTYRFGSGGDEGGTGDQPRFGQPKSDNEDLPYKVELWDERRASVEQVLAVTASGSIGYAAYYAATREFPHRYITLRHKNSIVSRWNGPSH
ncbi:MAG TPA: hypothetical protein VFB45_25110 [Pseudolabrys sp.]|nr:hypothetical protein [Pseudolabrys sp.]